MKTVVFHHAAAKALDALDARDQTAILKALDGYAIDGRGDVKALTGSGGFRMRVGRWRVLFDEDATTILAIYVGKRETTTYKKGRT